MSFTWFAARPLHTRGVHELSCATSRIDKTGPAVRQHQPAPNPITGTSREGLAVNATQPPEEWRPAVGHEGAYEVSDQGRVRSLDRMVQNRLGHMVHYRGQLLKPRASGPRGKQYLMVSMTNGAPAKVHHLVAAAFIGPNPGGMHVCHNDGNRWNNRAENLRYGTASENNFDIVSHGRHRNAVKTRCPQGHSLSGSNLVNFELPYRKCRACAAAHAYVQRNPAESFEYHADRYYKRYAPREVA